MKRIAVISVFLLAVSTFLPSQTIYKLGFDELLEKGLAASLTLQMSQIKTQVSADKVSLSKNKRLPDIAFSGLFGYTGKPSIYNTDLSFLKHSATTGWKQNYQVNVTQPIYEGGRITHNVKRAELEQLISQLVLEQDKSDLKLWLIGKYLDLINLYKEKQVYTQNIEEARVRLHDIKKMFEQGMITSNDVLRSEITLSNYNLSLTETNNNIALTSQQLTIVMAMDENLVIEPDTAIFSKNKYVTDNTDYVASGYDKLPAVKISETNKSLAQNNLKLVKADFLPTLSLQLGNTFQRPIPNTSPIQDLYINTWGVSLSLTYKLSSLFDRKRSLSVARHEIQLHNIAYELEKQEVRTNVKSAYVKHQEALNKVEVLNNTVSQAKENYRITKNKYFNQLAILTDLLDANNVLLATELQLTAARTNVIYTYYNLQKASGSL